MRYRAAIPLLSVLLGLLLANFYQGSAQVAVITAANPPGYMGPSFFYNQNPTKPTLPPSLVKAPTGEKPQSKLWFNDGRWWADLVNSADGKYYIYWLNLATQTWVKTNTTLDTRAQTKADCLWDGVHLYVASGGGSDNSGNAGTIYPHPGWLYRYSYDAASKTYTPDFGPILIRNGGAETIVLDKDTTGRLWITYTQNFKVYVNHSRTSDQDWDPYAAFVLPTPDARWSSVSADDISTLVAFDGKIGVLWSNESTGQFSGSSDTAFYFAYHVDGASDTTWASTPIYRQPSAADDHLDIKSLQADAAGNVFAMVKTSFNTNGQPQLLLIVAKKNTGGTYSWGTYVESTRTDNQTRPILLIDTSHRTLYVFTSTEGGGDVYYKSTSIDKIQFASGPGTLFINRPGFLINNATSTKQTVNATSGIVVLASHDNWSIDTSSVDYYFHNYIDLYNIGPTPTPDPSKPTATPIPTAVPNPTPSPSPTPSIGPGANNRRLYVPVVQR